jgi:iron complex outermembrane receptor protein
MHLNVAQQICPAANDAAWLKKMTSFKPVFIESGAGTLWGYEIGAKLELLDCRLLFFRAVFQINASSWEEFNVLVNDQGQAISANLITPDANVRSRGFELEVTGEASAKLGLAASFGYVDSAYNDYTDYIFSATQDFIFPAAQDFTGNRVRLVPECDASRSASRRPWKGLFVRGKVVASDNTPLNPENTAFQDAVVLIGREAERWSARLYAENLANELVFKTNAFANFAFVFDGTLYAGVAPLHVVGVQFS